MLCCVVLSREQAQNVHSSFFVLQEKQNRRCHKFQPPDKHKPYTNLSHSILLSHSLCKCLKLISDGVCHTSCIFAVFSQCPLKISALFDHLFAYRHLPVEQSVLSNVCVAPGSPGELPGVLGLDISDSGTQLGTLRVAWNYAMTAHDRYMQTTRTSLCTHGSYRVRRNTTQPLEIVRRRRKVKASFIGLLGLTPRCDSEV